MTGPWWADPDGMWHPADSDDEAMQTDDVTVPAGDDDYDQETDQ